MPYCVVFENNLPYDNMCIIEYHFTMKRFHVPIIALAIVSPVIGYIVLTQTYPYETTPDGTIVIHLRNIVFFFIAAWLLTFSWTGLGIYAVLRFVRPLLDPRKQTKKSLKISAWLATGFCCTCILHILSLFTYVTGSLLWITILVAIKTFDTP